LCGKIVKVVNSIGLDQSERTPGLLSPAPNCFFPAYFWDRPPSD